MMKRLERYLLSICNTHSLSGEITDDILMNTDFLFQGPCQKR